jgi:hypothetical protein
VAGPQWGQRSPEDIVAAIEAAGFAIVPKDATDKMVCAALDEFDKRGRGGESYRTIWQAMLRAV